MKTKRKIAIVIATITAACIQSTSAAVIASDSFLSGGNPAAGEYADATPLDFNPGAPVVNPTVAGFTGGWESISTNITGFVQSAAGGIDTPTLIGEAGGSVAYSSGGNPDTRDVQRELTTGIIVSTSDQYWLSALTTVTGFLDPTATGFVNVGFTDGLLFDANSRGYQIGYLGDGTAWDLVLRHRTNGGTFNNTVLSSGIASGEIHHVLLRTIANTSSFFEDLDIWLDPADVSSVAALGAPDFQPTDASLYGGTASFTHLSIQGGTNSAATFVFDELSLGTDLSDVVTSSVPEPSTVALFALLGIAAATSLRKQRRDYNR